MLFSSAIFLFYFLPCLFLIYFLPTPIKIKNYVLLIFSLIFFAWGGIFFTLILLCSILFNFSIGLGIDKYRSKIIAGIGIAGNLLILISFKYSDFIIGNLNVFLKVFNME